MRSGMIVAVVLVVSACGGTDDAAEKLPSNSLPVEAATQHSDHATAAAPAEAANANATASAGPAPPAGPVSPCLIQGNERLAVKARQAIGTEPFWGARIEGRCVTYTLPENQAGTRVWTSYTKRPDGETWSGALGGHRFELQTRAKPGCSDGMSDNSYPLEVRLIVNGAELSGCADTNEQG